MMSSSPIVLHLIDSFGTGGAQRRLLNDLKYLNGALTHRVYALFGDKGQLVDELHGLNISTSCLRLRHLTDLPLGVYRLAQIIRAEPAIQLIHTQLFCADTVGRFAGRLCRRLVISTFQSAIYEPESGLNSYWRRWVDRRTVEWGEHFIAVSGFVKQSVHIRLRIPLDRISVIHNSVDLERVTPEPSRRSAVREQLRLTEQDFTWITVGRPNPQKGYQFLLAAMPQVRVAFPRTRLLIVGDGPQRKSLEEALSSLGLSGVVQCMGERRDVVALLDGADAFVFPSLSEGLPLALLEAMAMGKPCVASRIGPHEELIEHGRSGLLVTPGDPSALATAMCQTQAEPETRLQFGQLAREQVARRFDAASCAQELGHLYETLIARNRNL